MNIKEIKSFLEHKFKEKNIDVNIRAKWEDPYFKVLIEDDRVPHVLVYFNKCGNISSIKRPCCSRIWYTPKEAKQVYEKGARILEVLSAFYCVVPDGYRYDK